MLLRVVLSIAACLALVCSAHAQGQSPDEVRHIQHQGIAREFILYRPAPKPAEGPRPLIVVLHGLGGTASDTRNWGYEPVADREGIVIAYPQGIEERWSYGRPITNRPMPRIGATQVDDIGFIGKLVDALIAERLADRSRVYVVGLSNGALMAYTAACSMTRRLAAAAALLSPMTSLQIEDCRPDGTIPLLVLGGTHDRMMAYHGVKLPAGSLASMRDTIRYWRKINGCDRFRLTGLPHRNADDPTKVALMRWETCAAGSEIVSYRIEGGGHRAPSLAPPSDREQEWERKAGVRNRDIETPEEVWSFFKRFSRK
jgi:polyhydroxybutyrate depolymerase